MSTPNRLARTLSWLEPLPGFAARFLQTQLLTRTVPFLGTAGVEVVELSPDRVVLRLANRRAVRNHLGGVHAAATILLAEAATGTLVALNAPDSAVYLAKTVHVDFVRRARGGLVAVAELDPATRRRLGDERGESDFVARISDEDGNEPVAAMVTWAWRSREKKTPEAAAA